jgi:preprotein translocase subunit SecG
MPSTQLVITTYFTGQHVSKSKGHLQANSTKYTKGFFFVFCTLCFILLNNNNNKNKNKNHKTNNNKIFNLATRFDIKVSCSGK